MLFSEFAKFRRMAVTSASDVLDYLDKIYNRIISELNVGLKQLRFEDNFQCQRLTATINSDTNTTINHNMKVVPNNFLSMNGISGITLISRSRDTIVAILDTDVYAAGVSKEIDIIIFK